MDFLIYLLSAVTVQSALLAAVAWLCKGLVTHQLSKEMEAFKHQLQVEAARTNVIFAKLHERRAEVVAGLYADMVDFEISARKFTYLENEAAGTTQQFVEVMERALKLQNFFNKHRIYFPEQLAVRIDTYQDELVEKLKELHSLSKFGRLPEELQGKLFTAWGSLIKHMNESLPLIKAELEASFRDLLGVHESDRADGRADA